MTRNSEGGLIQNELSDQKEMETVSSVKLDLQLRHCTELGLCMHKESIDKS